MQPAVTASTRRLWLAPALRGSAGSDGSQQTCARSSSCCSWTGWFEASHALSLKLQFAGVANCWMIALIWPSMPASVRIVSSICCWRSAPKIFGKCSTKYFAFDPWPNQIIFRVSFFLMILKGRSFSNAGSSMTTWFLDWNPALFVASCSAMLGKIVRSARC